MAVCSSNLAGHLDASAAYGATQAVERRDVLARGEAAHLQVTRRGTVGGGSGSLHRLDELFDAFDTKGLDRALGSI
jgi:hypothetical protein